MLVINYIHSVALEPNGSWQLLGFYTHDQVLSPPSNPPQSHVALGIPRRKKGKKSEKRKTKEPRKIQSLGARPPVLLLFFRRLLSSGVLTHRATMRSFFLNKILLPLIKANIGINLASWPIGKTSDGGERNRVQACLHRILKIEAVFAVHSCIALHSTPRGTQYNSARSVT